MFETSLVISQKQRYNGLAVTFTELVVVFNVVITRFPKNYSSRQGFIQYTS